MKVYDKTKPDRYGIKMYVIADSKSKYVLYLEPHARCTDHNETHFSGVEIFKRLIQGAQLPSGIRICADRFFMDYSLVAWCTERHYTVLGTVRGDKRCVPASVRKEHMRGDPERYSRTVYAPGCSLSAFIPDNHAGRNFKVVLVLSSEHLDARVDGDSGKPHSILSYNELKPGVDMLNWCLKEYSTKKTSRQWSM